MTVLGAIGDVFCFPQDKKLVGTCLGQPSTGSGARFGQDPPQGWDHQAGTARSAHSTGRSGLGRCARLEVLTAPVRQAGGAHRQGEGHRGHTCTCRAGTSVARKLPVTAWHVLTKGGADRHADPEQVAFKLMVWSWQLNDELRGGYNRPIASVEKVLALRPEVESSN